MAFDVTPAALITAIFTEAGVLEAPSGEAIARVTADAEAVVAAAGHGRRGASCGRAGNVSVRDGELVHITPRALPYAEMSATDVVTLDLTARWWRESASLPASGGCTWPSTRRGPTSALVHTHSVHATRAGASCGQPRRIAWRPHRAPQRARTSSRSAVVEALSGDAGRRVLMAQSRAWWRSGETPAALEVVRGVERPPDGPGEIA